jgi:hypothetical protein
MWKDLKQVTIVEGEAGGFYPDLKRYRRTMVWAEGRYILILDELRAATEVEFTWLVQSGAVESLDEDNQRFKLIKENSSCEFQIVSEGDYKAEVVDSKADHRGKPLGWKQLQLKRKAKTWRLVTIFNPWNRNELDVQVEWSNEGAKLNVKGTDIQDVLNWEHGEGDDPSAISLRWRNFQFDTHKSERL